MKTKISAIALFLILSATVHAATILPIPHDEGFFAKVGRCTWHLSCYFRPLFGATITTIQGTDTLKDSRTTINNNFTSLNNYKIENSSSSIAAITTLPNLATVGTTLSINGNLGVGTSSPSTTLGVVGSIITTATSTLPGIRVATSTLQFGLFSGGTKRVLCADLDGSVTISGCVSVDQTANYDWTGSHTHTSSSTWNGRNGATGAGINVNATTTTGMLNITNGNIAFNGQTYRLPPQPSTADSGGRRIASSTALMMDGAGQLSWSPPDIQQVGETISSSTNRFTSVNNLPPRKAYYIDFYTPGQSAANNLGIILNMDMGQNYNYFRSDDDFSVAGNNISSTSAGYLETYTAAGGTTNGKSITGKISNSSGNPKTIHWEFIDHRTAGSPNLGIRRGIGDGAWHNTTANVSSITIYSGKSDVTFNTNTRLTVWASED